MGYQLQILIFPKFFTSSNKKIVWQRPKKKKLVGLNFGIPVEKNNSTSLFKELFI